jgi:hypothetical protein
MFLKRAVEPSIECRNIFMTKHINLTKGFSALVDDEDYEWLSRYNWFAVSLTKRVYAARARTDDEKRMGAPQLIFMHREIHPVPTGYETDHKNNDSLDNRRENLRTATIAQNRQNSKKRSDNTSGYKGVIWSVQAKKWLARISADNKRKYIGIYSSPDEAARAYDAKARELHGEFARTNFP